ncbi:hypothetical protein VUR80DRAFT_5249 [Thermomyces stellatus]
MALTSMGPTSCWRLQGLMCHGLRSLPPVGSVSMTPGLAGPRRLFSENGSGTSKTTTSIDESSKPPKRPVTTLRYPRSVEALYLRPLRRETEYGIPSCDLQLRSYSVRSLEFFSDFALRAAYYLNLPAFGPIPLPRITERWTVPRSNFIFKKSQENFERITLRRLIQIRDGNPETVQVWLAFLQKHAYSGVGMKANIWEFSKLGMSQAMKESEAEVASELEESWAHLGQRRPIGSPEVVEERLRAGRSRTMGS